MVFTHEVAEVWSGVMINGNITKPLSQIVKYFGRYPKDIVILKTLVGTLLVVDFGQLFVMFSSVYLYTAAHWGQLKSIYQLHQRLNIQFSR